MDLAICTFCRSLYSQEETALQKVVDQDTVQLARLRDAAAKECAGGRGTGFTGRPGDGPRCRQRTADADEFARTHPIEERSRKLSELRIRVAGLEQQFGDAVSSFEQIRDRKIADRVAEERSHHGPIGFLERMDALHELAGSSSALFAGTWAVRLFFVAIDCLPVVVKFFGGGSGYDRLYRVMSGSTQRIFTDEVTTEERRMADQHSAQRDKIDNQARMRRAEHELTLQEHQVALKSRLEVAVNDLTAKLLRDPRPPLEDDTRSTLSQTAAGSNGRGDLNGHSTW